MVHHGRKVLSATLLIFTVAAVPGCYYNTNVLWMGEVAAVGAIQTIHKAQVEYLSQNERYAASLAELGADLIGGKLASGEKQGYKFAIAATSQGYAIHADPVTYGSSGKRSFYSDQTLVIRENAGPEPATATSRELK